MSPFDPEGDDYDYDTAKDSGVEADETGHWPSLDPRTGMVLKGRKHKSWNKTEEVEKDLGNEIIKKDGRYYSVPRKFKQFNKERKKGPGE